MIQFQKPHHNKSLVDFMAKTECFKHFFIDFFLDRNKSGSDISVISYTERKIYWKERYKSSFPSTLTNLNWMNYRQTDTADRAAHCCRKYIWSPTHLAWACSNIVCRPNPAAPLLHHSSAWTKGDSDKSSKNRVSFVLFFPNQNGRFVIDTHSFLKVH